MKDLEEFGSCLGSPRHVAGELERLDRLLARLSHAAGAALRRDDGRVFSREFRTGDLDSLRAILATLEHFRRVRRAAGVQRTVPAARHIATLVHDSRLPPRMAGARAAGDGPARLRYQAEAVEIDLELSDSKTPGCCHLLGQVAADSHDLARVWVVADGPDGRREAPVDDLGQFVLDDLPAGLHRLEIDLSRAVIEISGVLL